MDHRNRFERIYAHTHDRQTITFWNKTGIYVCYIKFHDRKRSNSRGQSRNIELSVSVCLYATQNPIRVLSCRAEKGLESSTVRVSYALFDKTAKGL